MSFTPPNYTSIPNELIDDHLHTISKEALSIFILLFRYDIDPKEIKNHAFFRLKIDQLEGKQKDNFNKAINEVYDIIEKMGQ